MFFYVIQTNRGGPMTTRSSWLCLALLISSVALFGQGSSVGTITGEITDPSGAPVPEALISVRNVDTNLSREMRTGQTGVYTISSLPVATHELRATATGFQTTDVKDIKLDVN